MSLHTEFSVHRDAFELHLAASVKAGHTLCLLGPNGAGKSTALRTLAGLLSVSEGRLELDGQTLDDAARKTFVPPERRPTGVVFQDYLLFGHLTVLENVAFGPRARGTNRHEARRRAQAWLEHVGMHEYAQVKPAALSGGQAQRVALARALVTEPRLLLLDEPLAALDARTKMDVRAQLSQHLDDYAGVTILVTHDPLDAMVLADSIVVLENGRVVQQGTPSEVAQRPRTNYVANLVGLNLYRGCSSGTHVQLDSGGSLSSAVPHDGAVLLAVPPAAVSLHRDKPSGSQRNVWPVTVRGLESRGEISRVQLTGAPDVLVDVTHIAVRDLDMSPGTQLWAALKATEIRTYPA